MDLMVAGFGPYEEDERRMTTAALGPQLRLKGRMIRIYSYYLLSSAR